MRILLISDTHYFNDIFEDILNHHQDHIDLYVHCGDSSLEKDHELMKKFDIVVKGNHDYEDYPEYSICNNILVAHGHLQDVYLSYDKLIDLCHFNGCNICLHGHTHIPTIQTIDGITFINPGSSMMNRGQYGFGTYAIVDLNDEIKVNYYHHITHELVDYSIIEEGFELLKEFKDLLSKKKN